MSKRLGSLVLLIVAMLLSSAWFQSKPSRYVYVWAGNGTMHHMGTDVIAVIDADASSATYAKVIDVLTVDAMGGMPHHSEFDTPANATSIFVNDYHLSKSYMINFKNPAKPTLAGQVALTPGAHTPHSFARLASGHVLATIQFGDGKVPGNPGGVAEFDASGKFIRYSRSRTTASTRPGSTRSKYEQCLTDKQRWSTPTIARSTSSPISQPIQKSPA